MSNFMWFILVVGIIIIVFYAILKFVLRESFVVDTIIKGINKPTFDEEKLAQLRELLNQLVDITNRMPSGFKFDVSGNNAVLAEMSDAIAGVTPAEAKDRIIKVLDDYNTQVDGKDTND